MVGRVAKYSMGIQDNGKDTHRRDNVSTSIWK